MTRGTSSSGDRRRPFAPAGILLALLVSAGALSGAGCRSCTTREARAVSPEGDGAKAVISTRKCGADEGWVVTVESGGAREVVFEGRAPKSIPVERVLDSLWVVWRTPTSLAISIPSWARIDRQRTRVGGVRVVHEIGWIPFPAVTGSPEPE